MASTYTSSSGLEKIGSGEQAGRWGTTTNTNLDIIDRTVNGILTLSVSGNVTLSTSEGALSQGHHKIIVLSGSPPSDFDVLIDPENQPKWYIIKNGTAQTATIKQGTGSGSTVDVPAGASNIVYADGNNPNSNVVLVPTDLVNDASPQLGADLDTNGNAILFGSSKWSIELDTGDDDLLFKYNGTTVFKLASSGAVTSADNITAFGTSL